MAACYGLGYYHEFWRRGALIRARSVPGGAMLIELRPTRFAVTANEQPPYQPRDAALLPPLGTVSAAAVALEFGGGGAPRPSNGVRVVGCWLDG